MTVVATQTELIDGWTVAHVAAGVLAGAIRVRPLYAFGVAIMYEPLEQFVERSKWGEVVFGTDGPESFANAAVDVVVFGVGYLAGWALVTHGAGTQEG